MHSVELRPKEAVVAVNYRCNARCRMCDIWRVKKDGLLVAEDYRRLPGGLENVGITGGEPFLRRDIVELVRVVHETADRPQIVINSNGYLTGRIVEAFREFRTFKPRIGIGLSVDGIGKTHDMMRGTRHAFDKVMATITALKELNVSNIRLSFTVTNDNVAELPAVYDLARRLKVQFASTIAHNSDHYFHTSANGGVDRALLRQAYDVVNRKELSSRSVKSWFRAYYNAGVVQFNDRGTRLTACSAANDFFFVSPRGDVYPCIILPKVLGNIMDTSFDELWTGSAASSIRAEIDGCEKCWMMCHARAGLKKHPIAAGAWVAKEQLRRLALC
jgi:radical SAM protein with 4Fe4S-binding SPASM domain